MRRTISMVAAATCLALIPPALASASGPPPPDPDPVTPSVSPSPSPSSTTQGPARQTVFNYPVPGTPDLALTNTLVDLIDGTPAGETVRLSYFVVQASHPAIDALLRAYGRGVSVKVVLDSGDGQKPKKNAAIDAAFARLAEVLGSNVGADSFAKQCNRSCITDEDDSINHNKFATFSRTGNDQNVVFQGTGNLRVDGSGDSAYNAAIVMRGDTTIYEQFVGYFGDLADERRVSKDNYYAARPPVTSGPVTTTFFPRTDKTDTVAAALSTVNCAATPTLVRVMAAYFSRKKVRNVLRNLSYAGCTVRVIARQDSITRDFCEGIDPRSVAIKIAPSPKQDRVSIHAKYVLINGSYAGSVGQYVTWMGSHNLTDNALERNDETFLQFVDETINQEFATNWDRLWNDPAMSSGCSRAGAKDNAAVEKSGDTEVTKIARRSQTVKRALPARLRATQALRPARTAQGKRLRVVAYCSPAGSKAEPRRQSRCRVTMRRGVPVLSISSKRALRIRIVQRAKGTKRLLPFSRTTDYRYSPKAKRAIRS